MITGEPENTCLALRRLLARSELTESEVARRLGVTRITVHQAVLHQRPFARIETLAKYAAVCGGRLILELPDSEFE